MARHYLDLPATTIMTDALAEAVEAIDEAVKVGGLVVLDGVPGVGKTHAQEYALEGHSDRHPITVGLTTGTRPATMLAEIVDQAGIERVPRGGWALKQAARRALTDRCEALAVEEFQDASNGCADDVRWLFDRPTTRFALIITGGREAWAMVQDHEHLSSRVTERVKFEELSKDDMLEVLPRWHPFWGGPAGPAAEFVYERWAGGVFRSWSTFTYHATRLCEQREQVLDEHVAREVFGRLRGSGEISARGRRVR